jgi:hypothetical protein
LKASELYNAIRLFIAAYVWMTGFGNFSYYYVRKVGPAFAVFQETSNGCQFLRDRRSNRHIVPLYGKCDGLYAQGLKFETR